MNDILNKKKDINYIENIQNIFSNDSYKNILDNIVNEEKDITVSDNETIIQITFTNNTKK